MMKDKLYKNNHKTFYYLSRKAVLSVAIFLGLAVAVAVPTTVNLLSNKQALTTQAQEEETETVNNNEENNLEELAYNS